MTFIGWRQDWTPCRHRLHRNRTERTVTTTSLNTEPTTLAIASAEPTPASVRADILALGGHRAVVDRHACAPLEQAVTAAEARAARRLSLVLRLNRLDDLTRTRAHYVLRQVLAVDTGERLTDAVLATVVVDLRDKDVRDLLFALPYTEHADAADRLWATLAMRLSGPDRAEPAALLAFSAYVRENTQAAESAVAVALDADAEHRIAGLLAFGLATGMPASRLRRLAESGCEAAQEMGIAITLRA